MTPKDALRRNRYDVRAWAFAVVGAALAAGLTGCSGPEDKVPPAKVETVKAYGMTLDENATPKQVAFVLLRSLADDVQAARVQPPRREEQKKANLITWSVAAPNIIADRLLKGLQDTARDPSKVSLGKDRDKEVYRVVNLWAPIVAYYVDSFDKDPEPAMNRMHEQVLGGGRVAHIFYEVWPAPSRPDADRHQTLDIELVKEKGSEGAGEYWRVARVSYVPQGIRPASRPAGTVGTRPATLPG